MASPASSTNAPASEAKQDVPSTSSDDADKRPKPAQLLTVKISDLQLGKYLTAVIVKGFSPQHAGFYFKFLQLRLRCTGCQYDNGDIELLRTSSRDVKKCLERISQASGKDLDVRMEAGPESSSE